jgi:nitrile hydratase
VLREFGPELPKNKRVAVHDSSADLRCLVLPQRPEGTEGMSEDELAALVTRDSLVGTDVPHAAREASRVQGPSRPP